MPFQTLYRTVGMRNSRFLQKYFGFCLVRVFDFVLPQEEFSYEIPLQRVWEQLPVVLERLDLLIVPGAPEFVHVLRKTLPVSELRLSA